MMAQRIQRKFQQSDVDNHGSISEDEFSKLDVNDDRQLTQEEASKGIEKMMATMKGMKDAGRILAKQSTGFAEGY